MSEIHQWSVARSELCPVGEESVEVVTYADHLAALTDVLDKAHQRLIYQPSIDDPMGVTYIRASSVFGVLDGLREET